MFQSFAAHLLRNAGNNAVGHGLCRLRGVVARADAGSSGGQQNIHAFGIGQFTQTLANPGGIVGNRRCRGDFPAQPATGGDDSWARTVFVLALGHAIANRENRYAHEEGI